MTRKEKADLVRQAAARLVPDRPYRLRHYTMSTSCCGALADEGFTGEDLYSFAKFMDKCSTTYWWDRLDTETQAERFKALHFFAEAIETGDVPHD